MTLSNSKSSRYDIDERLSIDTPTPMRGPLQLVSIEKGRNDSAHSRSALQKQRSIFSEYWKADPRPSRLTPPVSPKPIEEEKQHSPRRRRIIHSTYNYNYDRNPFLFFGIEEDEGKTSSTDDDDDTESLNSYERILQKNEVECPEKNRRRSTTCPSLSRSMVGIEGMILDTTPKTTQSDTILFVKKRLSCLRPSRYSFDTDSTDSDTSGFSSYKKGKGKVERRPSVSFEATIKVHLFEPPVEKWAPTGWSNWFGGWN